MSFGSQSLAERSSSSASSHDSSVCLCLRLVVSRRTAPTFAVLHTPLTHLTEHTFHLTSQRWSSLFGCLIASSLPVLLLSILLNPPKSAPIDSGQDLLASPSTSLCWLPIGSSLFNHFTKWPMVPTKRPTPKGRLLRLEGSSKTT